MTCPTCNGKGTTWEWDFDCSKRVIKCRDCQPQPKRFVTLGDVTGHEQRRRIAGESRRVPMQVPRGGE